MDGIPAGIVRIISSWLRPQALANDNNQRPVLYLHRVVDTLDDSGCYGVLTDDRGGKICYIAELNWAANRRNESCIPRGNYKVDKHESPTHKSCFVVRDVPHRSDILIHSGNWVGNKQRGMLSDSDGCLLPGQEIRGVMHTGSARLQLGVSQSKLAMELLLHKYSNGFDLIITGGRG